LFAIFKTYCGFFCYFTIIKEAEAVGLGPFVQGVDGTAFRGIYRTKATSRRIYVIVYTWDRVPNQSVVSESVLAVPLEWISQCWKFVAVPPPEENGSAFYYAQDNPEAVSTNLKYSDLVRHTWQEYPISRYAKRMGCK
jgi:hypothetical protein